MLARFFIPATIGTLPRREALAFLSLFFVPAAVQAILLTVLPLEALHLLGTARTVTLLYVGTGLVAIVGRFSIPFLVRLIRRRFVFTLGTLLLALSSALMALEHVPSLALGLVFSTFGFACVEVTSQLYLLDHVPRQALKHFEPMRLFASAGPWMIGPWLGVYLQQHVTFATPFIIAGVASILLLGLFWSLRLGENAMLTAMRRPPTNPLRYLRRFFAQPRLRLAWTLAAARSSWWSTFYVYAPIFAVTAGLGAEVGGIVTSIGTGWILDGAAVGLGRPPHGAATAVAHRLRGRRRPEHFCQCRVRLAVGGRHSAGHRGIWHRDHRRCRQPAVPARGAPLREVGNDHRVRQLPRCRAAWIASGMFSAAVGFQPVVGFRRRGGHDVGRVSVVPQHSATAVKKNA